MNYTDQFKAIVIGALLHDIGKFWQRSDHHRDYKKSNIISTQTRNNISAICPKWNNDYSHKHALWTNEFFLQYGHLIKQKAVFFDFESLNEDNPANLGSYHHNPSSSLQHLIQVADWYSSGMDRRKGEDIEDEIKGFRYRKVRLKPVFENIALDGKDFQPGKYRFELKALKYGECIFPKLKGDLTEGNDQGELNVQYEKLWNEFVVDFKQIKSKNFYQYIGAFLSLLERYRSSPKKCVKSRKAMLQFHKIFSHRFV